MSMNIKNPRVEELARLIAERTGETKTEAIRVALEQRLEWLALYPQNESRKERLERFLLREVAPAIPKHLLGKKFSRREENRILGYGRHGV